MKYTIALLLVIALFAATTEAAPCKPGCIRIYEHTKQRGKSHIFCSSTSYKQFFRKWNDKASSYCVGKGANYILYQHKNRAGKRIVAKAGTCRDVPKFFNDHCSSISKVPLKKRKTKVCKKVNYRKCKTQRKKFAVWKYKKVAKKIRVKTVIRKKIAFKHPICKSSRHKVPYKRAHSYRKKVKYSVNVKKYYNQKYIQKYRKRVSYQKRHKKVIRKTKPAVKKITVKYWHYWQQAYWHRYSCTCKYNAKVRKIKRVPAVRKYSCKKTATRIVKKKVKVPCKVIKRRKKYFEVYVKVKKDCYRKKWIWEKYTVNSHRWVVKSFKQKYQKKSTCYKKYLKKIPYTITVVRKRKCWRKVKKYRRKRTRKSKVVKKRYTKVYYVTKYYNKTHYKYVTARRTRYRRAFKWVKQYRTKYVTAYKYSTAYRWVTRVKTSHVIRHRYKYIVGHKTKTVYRPQKYRGYIYKNVRVCVKGTKNVCKYL